MVARTLILRGVVLWFLARVMAFAMLGVAGAARGSAILPVWALTISAALVQLDLHRRKEMMLLHNLGVSTTQAICIGAVPALVFETVFLAL